MLHEMLQVSCWKKSTRNWMTSENPWQHSSTQQLYNFYCVEKECLVCFILFSQHVSCKETWCCLVWQNATPPMMTCLSKMSSEMLYAGNTFPFPVKRQFLDTQLGYKGMIWNVTWKWIKSCKQKLQKCQKDFFFKKKLLQLDYSVRLD